MHDLFDARQGESPLLISFPHDGTKLSPGLGERLTGTARKLPDTDWHIFELYDFIGSWNSSWIRARYSRYVVDLNRSGTGGALYPGRFETPVCPRTTFSGEDVYLVGRDPDEAEISERIERYWQPYHDHIKAEIGRIKALHGFVILWDAHSIFGQVPDLFDGILPDLNFGTADGTSIGQDFRNRIRELADAQSGYSWVIDGRFKGGYITRQYGQPDENIHAIQLEINQSTYLSPGPQPTIESARAAMLSDQVRKFVEVLM